MPVITIKRVKGKLRVWSDREDDEDSSDEALRAETLLLLKQATHFVESQKGWPY